MAGYWILKTEPSSYSYDDLERERRAVWDGVKNPVALRNMRAMAPGDRLLIYHTGDEKAVVGTAVVVAPAYPDPKLADPSRLVVDIEATGPVKQPVRLADIRKEREFADLALVRMPRLSVVPATEAQFAKLVEMSEKGGESG
jgi:predicted RNA-binding protein with PUA-like domain